MNRKLIYLLLSATILLSYTQIKASHTAGMEMFYRHVSGNTYEFTLYFFRNCNGASAPTSIQLRAKSLSLGVSNLVAGTMIIMPGSGIQPPNLYNCTYANICYEEYIYRGQVNLNTVYSPSPQAVDWIFYYELCCRPGGVALPENIYAGTQYIECGLNNKDFPSGNSSPFWHNSKPNHPGHLTDTLINYLMRTVCEGSYYLFDQSTREYQGDSVTYEYFIPQDGGGAPTPYLGPYSFFNPMPTMNGPLKINPFTGFIPLVPGTPLNTGVFVLGIKATEWRYDTIISGGAFVAIPKKIGFVKRDFTVWIDRNLTCRRDSAHIKDIVISNGGADTVLNLFFHSGKPGEPNTLIRCASLSPDGSEFRLIDSTNYVAPFDTTVRSIGVNRAVWDCNLANHTLTSKVTIHLAEPLKCQKYYVMLKKGSDLDVIESECGFFEPEFSYGKVVVNKKVQVKADTSYPKIITVCLPNTDPFPKLNAWSTDSASFPLEYHWAFNGDTVEGQNVPYIWAEKTGTYEVKVRDPYNCTGSDSIKVYFDSVPGFGVNVPLYCDEFGKPADLPDFIIAPDEPGVTRWEWFSTLGKMGEGDTLRTPQLLNDITYILKGTKDPKGPGAEKCYGEYTFQFTREEFPPQNPLWVDFGEDELSLCLSDDEEKQLVVWDEGVSKRFAPLDIQWYYYTIPITGQELTRTIKDSGYYMVHVTDTLGCWGRDTVHVRFVNRFPAANIPCKVNGNEGSFYFEWGQYDPYIIENQISIDGGNTWMRASDWDHHLVNNVRIQKYILGRGVVENGCEYTEVGISNECPDDVFPPNVITPNGDGLNDYFIVRGLDLFDRSEVEIFDRWGNKIFQDNDYRNNWDGADHPEGTYYYVLRVDDPDKTVKKGYLTLLR